MNNVIKSLENNALAALSNRAGSSVTNAIKTASAKTGVSFTYLMEKAAAESNFKADAKAKTSSATGLFQFIESTWMDMMNKHGAKHGVNTNQSRQDLLNLRKDPKVASLMAAEFAEGNKEHLQQTIGGKIGNTELYFAHFMGAGGASAFLSQHKKNPLVIAADIFPKEARANRNVFYDSKTGEPKTLAQVYDFFDKKFSGENNSSTSMAHKPNISRNGYHYLSPSMKKPIQILEANSLYQNASNNYARNSLYQMEQQLQAFFSPTSTINSMNSAFSGALYNNVASPESIILNLLK